MVPNHAQQLTNKDLALALVEAETKGDEEETILALNAIADRLELSLNATEQGLTPEAAKAVDEFVGEHFTS